MAIVSSWTLAVVLSHLLLLPAFAAQQLVTTKTLLVKNPPSGARKVLWKVKETAATVAGDPTADGATLRIQLTSGGDQCFSMPALGWTAIGTIGFKYKDATLTNGPVKVAQIKKTPSGKFLMKALLKNGGPVSIAITPGNPTASYATNFTLGTGDEYCGGTGTATPNPNDENTFKVSNDGAPSVSCIASCNGTTTTSTLGCGTPPCGPTTTSTSVTTTSSTFTTTTLGGAVCGNTIREAGEQCDDGNLTNLDGCDSSCLFEQSQRVNYLVAQFGTDASCTQNAFGGAIDGSAARQQLQMAIDSSIADGSTSVLLRLLDVDDLSGTNDASVQVGILTGTPVVGPGYDGTDDVDWWYTAAASTIDGNRMPITTLAGTIASNVTSAGPGTATLTLPLFGTPASLSMSDLTFTSTNGAASIPLASAGGPPGHLATENLDPTLQSWETSGTKTFDGAGTMCGNILAGSLANVPIPSSLVGCGLVNCSRCYTSSNTLLDVLVGGCTIFGTPQISSAQPDESVSGSVTYTFTTNAVDHHVNGCTANGAAAELSACLADAAYSGYFKFATDRVIIK